MSTKQPPYYENLKMMAAIFYSFLLVLGLILLFWGGREFFNARSLLLTGIRTDANVFRMELVTNSDGDTYRPHFEFQDQQDRRVEFSHKISSSPAAYTVGDRVKIVYDPDDPENARTTSFWGLYRWALISLSISGPLIVFGCGWILYHWDSGSL